MLPWGIRGHPLTRSMHLYIQNAYLAKALRLFCPKNGTTFEKWNEEMFEKWNKVREWNEEMSQKWNNVRKWNGEMFEKWNSVRKWNTGMYKNTDF